MPESHCSPCYRTSSSSRRNFVVHPLCHVLSDLPCVCYLHISQDLQRLNQTDQTNQHTTDRGIESYPGDGFNGYKSQEIPVMQATARFNLSLHNHPASYFTFKYLAVFKSLITSVPVQGHRFPITRTITFLHRKLPPILHELLFQFCRPSSHSFFGLGSTMAESCLLMRLRLLDVGINSRVFWNGLVFALVF